MSLSKVKMKYERVSIAVPEFIDNTSEIDYYVYNFIRDILDNINFTIVNKILVDRTIKNLINKCNTNMDSIFDLLGKNQIKYILILDYLNTYIDNLLNDLVEGEFYEPASNLFKLKKGLVLDARENL